MIDTADIEDALIAEIKATVPALKTVVPHEGEFDESKLEQIRPMVPFVLVRYGGLVPQEGQRLADNASGIKKESFHLAVGAHSLRSKQDAQRGAYSLLGSLRDKFDGFTLTVSGEPIAFGLESIDFLFAVRGLVVYEMVISFFES